MSDMTDDIVVVENPDVPSFQGDLAFRRVTALPKGAIPLTPTDNGYVVSHSESGHAHFVSPRQAAIFQHPQTPMILYAEPLDDVIDFLHDKPLVDPTRHKTLRFGDLGKGSYLEIIRQREQDPDTLNWRPVED